MLTALGQSELASSTAEALASGDAAALILLGRSQADVQPIFDTINGKYPEVKVIFITVEVCKLASVRGAADIIRKLEITIDGVVGFPTLMAAPWNTTPDGVEAHFQVNYLANWVLVNRLVETLGEEGRVVMVSSSIRPDAKACMFEDPNFDVRYEPLYSGVERFGRC